MTLAYHTRYIQDLYGNRDPPAASDALDHAASALASLKKLPEPFRSFYAQRAARQILQGVSDEAPPSDVYIATRSSSGPGNSIVQLHGGGRMPMVGFGTFQIPPGQVTAAVRAAIRVGVRHFDCAAVYRNESDVGAALHDALCAGDICRDEMFVTSKLWNTAHAHVRVACLDTIRALRLDYLDLYLIHWPVASGASAGTSLSDTWRQMESLVADGLVRAIGVSNFSQEKLKGVLGDPALRVAPAVNQEALFLPSCT